VALILIAAATTSSCGDRSSKPASKGPPTIKFGPVRIPSPTTDMAVGMHGSYPMPPSAWQANEAKIYAHLLATRKFDVLVVPFQVQEYGLDRPTRSLMTAELSRAVGRAQSSPMPDPYLVQKALGDGARRFKPELVMDLATRIGAKRIVWSYVGHARDGKMTITVKDQRWKGRDAQPRVDPGVIRNYEELPLSDAHPAIEVYQALLPQVLKDLGYEAASSTPQQVESSFTDTALPATPFGLTGGEANPARDAYYLQLLGALTPRRAERERERLFEKSLLAIEHMTPSSPQYRALKARAYLYLGLRPAALKVLGEPATAEEKALRAALNGNLPELNALIAQEAQLVPRLLELLEANVIAADYQVVTQKDSAAKAASLELPGEFWPALATRAFTDWDPWTQQENILLKYMLDRELPVAGYTAEGIIRGAAAIGDVTKVQTSANLSVLEHAHRLLASDAAKWCCSMPVDRPTARDYLNFMQATATDNLMRRANFFTLVQGSPESALEFLARIQSVYDGFPEFALERAKAEFAQARQTEGLAREGQSRAAYLDALNAVYWSNGQTRVAADAEQLATALGRQDFGFVDSWYASDFPFRPFFPNWERGGDLQFMLRNARAALKSSVSDFGPVRDLAGLLARGRGKPREIDAIIDSARDRFAGCPERDAFLAERSLKKGDFSAAEMHYREGIKDAPANWLSYDGLGTVLFRQGKTREAARAFMSYPGFRKDSGDNPVALSNYAFEAGSHFYWSGDFELAKPLYRMAADLKTGSGGSLTSEIRLHLLDGDYRGALQSSLVRARRYGSPQGYRDYLGMLHAMGQSDAAWSAFEALVPQLRASQLWETALVGHRIERKSEADIVAWIRQRGLGEIGAARDHAALYLARAGITDRMPSGTLAQSIDAFAWRVWRLPQHQGTVVRVSRGGPYPQVVGPKAWSRGSTLPNGVLETEVKEPVTSDLAYFIGAYRALRLGNASGAVTIFKEVTTFYDLTHPELRYLLPYYAFAAAKTGDAFAVESILDRIAPDERGFDYYLAKAVIAGLSGRTQDSLGLMKNALYRRPYTEERAVYPDYEYAETIEWLYRAAGRREYRELALDWVKKVERFTPWYAWPYAMQAELETNATQRRRAIAMAAYLDPGSERLAKISKAEVAKARRAFRDLNPFLQKAGKARPGSI
jgi:hypothetical protein